LIKKIMKIDPYNHEERYKEWKVKVSISGIPRITKQNSDLALQYLSDMEHGINISSVSQKGVRGYPRLNTLREKMIYFSIKFKEIYDLDCITGINENQIMLFFSKMRKGEICRKDGKRYISTNYFVKVFKAFWHWWQTSNRKKGIEIKDITIDLDTRGEKPKWVYLTENQIKKLCDHAKLKYKVLIMFLFDSGIRSPTELVNIKISDLYNECKELNIRDEISKTFGRKIKLMICSGLLKEYISSNDLKEEDYLFPISPPSVNQHLKRLSKRVLGNKESPAGESYDKLTMYDFRHCSCCYWLPRYKSESALKFRFGWKKSDKIHYYSEMLGMRDTITEEDLLVDITKTEIEKRLFQSENENQILKEKVEILEDKMKNILGLVEQSISNGERISEFKEDLFNK